MAAPARSRRKLDPFMVARSLLRPHLYVGLLDAVATTGYMPTLDRFGRLDPNFPAERVDHEDRLATLRFLVDKSLATPKADEGSPTVDLDTALRDLRALSAAELTALSSSETSDDLVVVLDEADANPLAAAPAPAPSRPPGAGAALTRED